MTRTKLIRVAFVRFSPMGKAYPTRCDRRDIEEGSEVEVLMRAESDDPYYMNGVVERIEFHRWNCTCRVDCLVGEAEYFITEDGEFGRRLNLPSAQVYEASDWMERKRAYYGSLSESARDEMKGIYRASAGEDGEDAYLGDGVWIRPDGSLDDRGR
ncbi:MAG: hypothetical protein H6933_02600 [Burkholderiaceae bacterium]|nr:hypothetical protein [Burkholderiaceae bacterium]